MLERQGQIAVAESGIDDVFIDDIIFPAEDGYALGATLFLPGGATRPSTPRHFGMSRRRRSGTIAPHTTNASICTAQICDSAPQPVGDYSRSRDFMRRV
jgi:hypothetical protein